MVFSPVHAEVSSSFPQSTVWPPFKYPRSLQSSLPCLFMLSSIGVFFSFKFLCQWTSALADSNWWFSLNSLKHNIRTFLDAKNCPGHYLEQGIEAQQSCVCCRYKNASFLFRAFLKGSKKPLRAFGVKQREVRGSP